jgi:hypothetical protein
VLTADDDEIPSRGLLDALPSLVDVTDVTHYRLSSRWLYPTAERFLDARPWRPDYQPRLGGTRAEVRRAGREEIDRLWPGRELAESDYRARLTLLGAVPPLRAGARDRGHTGREPAASLFPGARRSRSARAGPGTVIRSRGAHRPLPAPVAAGGSEIVPVPLAAPIDKGHRTLALDLVHEHLRWFECELRVEVEIGPSRGVALLDPGTDEALFDVLRRRALVITTQPEELARRFAGRIGDDLRGASRSSCATCSCARAGAVRSSMR